MKTPALLILVIAIAYTAPGQTFKRHQIGETAEHFFSVATMADNGSQTTAYCHLYLKDEKVLRAYEKAKKNIYDVNSIVKSSDVDGCHEVQDALDGKEVEVGARYASEFGSGHITFHNSKLALMVFNLKEGTLLQDVITDVTKELDGVAPVMSADTMQNGYGATLQQRKATWNTKTLMVEASEMRDFQYRDMGVLVIVADSDYFKQKEAERQAKRRNTIH